MKDILTAYRLLDAAERRSAWGVFLAAALVAVFESPGALSRRELTDELKRLLTCIGRLEPDRQRMLLLAYYGAFTREELAGKLDIPAALLKTSLRRSLSEIEQCLTS